MAVKDRLIISGREYDRLVAADEMLDQMGEDAQDIGQDVVARVAREAAIAIRRVTSRADKPTWDADHRILRG